MRPITSLLFGTLAMLCVIVGGCAHHKPDDRTRMGSLAQPLDSATLRADDQETAACFMGAPISATFVDIRVLENDGYLVGFSPEARTPIWVCYRLFHVEDPPDLQRPRVRFASDDRAGVIVTHDDYTNTGYDRGHMAPSAGIGRCYGEDAQVGTFLTSNICPQLPGLNQRAWERFEHKVANDYAERLGEVWVVTGPIFDGPCTEFESNVRVPDAFYKIIVGETNGQVELLGIVMENERTETSAIAAYVHTVDAIEARSGIDFFHELNDALEDAVEANAGPYAVWTVDAELRPTFPGSSRLIHVRDCD